MKSVQRFCKQANPPKKFMKRVCHPARTIKAIDYLLDDTDLPDFLCEFSYFCSCLVIYVMSLLGMALRA